MRDFVSSEVDQSTAREKLRRSQSRGQMFGLAATTVFFVTLILNARINGACHATGPAGASAKPLRGRADDVPTDCLDRSLLCSLCLRSQRFSHVVVTRSEPAMSSAFHQHRSAIDPCQGTPDGSSVLVSRRSHPDGHAERCQLSEVGAISTRQKDNANVPDSGRHPPARMRY
jgi:hypothetical protein